MKCHKCGSENITSISFTSVYRGKTTILIVVYCKDCRETIDKYTREEQSN